MLACPELRRLDPLLARHRLTEAETGQVVLSALKVELSQASVVFVESMFRVILSLPSTRKGVTAVCFAILAKNAEVRRSKVQSDSTVRE